MFHYKMQADETISLEVPESVYEPREDSLLIAAELEKLLENKNIKTVLEIGCGSGLFSIIAAKRDCEVTAADINPAAVECAKRNAELNGAKMETVQSDLFERIGGKFDLIVFNPPYLPEEQTAESRAWAGGKNLEVVAIFIREAKAHLNSNGKILIVISSLSNPENVLKAFSDNGFGAEIVAEQKIPWEKLFVISAKITEAKGLNTFATNIK